MQSLKSSLPVISYAASLWRTQSYSCVDYVQLRTMPFILGMGRYTPNNAIYFELAWHLPLVKPWKSVAHHWRRVETMDNILWIWIMLE